MSWQFWFFLIVGAVSLILLVTGVVARRISKRTSSGIGPAGVAGAVGLALALIVLALGCATIVGTRQIGIVTTFGRPTGTTLDNGLHFKAPWAVVTEMDGAIQNDTYKGDHRIAVRLGNNSTALADVSIRWEIQQSAADGLFVQYKTFDNVRVNLIERNLQAALNEAFAKFDPLATKNLNISPLPEIGQQTLKALQAKVGEQVTIFDVVIPTIDYDDQTEGRINDINAERARTTAAEQAVKTAEQQRKANEMLALAPTPPSVLVVIANCVNKSVEKGLNPAGCWPIGQGVLPTVAVPNPGS